MSNDLSGRVVLVTGGNSGIGLGIAHAVVGAGADVAIWGRNPDKNEAALDELTRSAGRAICLTVDVTDEQAVIDATRETVSQLGKIDTTFANAGFGSGGTPFTKLTVQEWRHVQATNSEGAMVTLRESARHMIERGEGGALIGVGSTSEVHGAPMNLSYSFSKAGLAALMRGLAVELARYKIRSNTLRPGWIHTAQTESLEQIPAFVEATTRRTPIRRWGHPEELGPAAVFLADPANMWHTGDTVTADGGYTIF